MHMDMNQDRNMDINGTGTWKKWLLNREIPRQEHGH